jgi:branched-chain amino acid transport system permease protein
MDYFFGQLANGLSLGCVYALIALGFAMVYGVLKLLNFAHSEIFTTGAFVAYFCEIWLLRRLPGQPLAVFALSMAAAGLGAGLAAVVMERLAYRPLRGQPKVVALLTAIGVSVLLQNLGIHAFGAQTRGFPPLSLPWPPKPVAAMVLAVSFAVLYLLVHHSRAGIRMRAVAEDPETAVLMGVDPSRVVVLTFFLGGLFAGIAGTVWGLIYGTVHPQMGFYPGLKAFIIAVVGSVGSLTGTFLIGISLGVAEALAAAYLPSSLSAFKDSLTFVLLLAALAWRPAGLFGTAEPAKV